MKRHIIATACVILGLSLTSWGCARAARDTSGFSLREEAAINAPFEETWHTVKHVLREQGYEVYTRDKRGIFVAYTPMKRMLWLQPRRTKFTVELAQTSPEETAIAVESIRQVYGVTLLTHPGWHDRKQTDAAASQAILDAVRAKIAEGGIEAEGFIEMPGEDAQDDSGEGTAMEAEGGDSSPLTAETVPVVSEAETVE